MKNTTTILFLALMLGTFSFPVATAEQTQIIPKNVQNNHQKMGQIEKQIADLEEQKIQLQRMAEEAKLLAERKQELEIIKNEILDYMDYIEEEIAEMNEEKEPHLPAFKHFKQAQRDHLAASHAIYQRIADASRLEDAQTLAMEHEILATKWWMLLEPKFEFLLVVQEMEKTISKEPSNKRSEILSGLKSLHQKNTANRHIEFELFKKRLRIQAEMDKLINKF